MQPLSYQCYCLYIFFAIQRFNNHTKAKNVTRGAIIWNSSYYFDYNLLNPENRQLLKTTGALVAHIIIGALIILFFKRKLKDKETLTILIKTDNTPNIKKVSP